jgi:hypothetical protein
MCFPCSSDEILKKLKRNKELLSKFIMIGIGPSFTYSGKSPFLRSSKVKKTEPKGSLAKFPTLS